MNSIFPLRVAVVSLGLFAAALANGVARECQELSKLDLNGDGVLTEWEIKAAIQYRMNKANPKEPGVDFRALHEKLEGKKQVTEKDIGEYNKGLTSVGYAYFQAIYGTPRKGGTPRYPLNGVTYNGQTLQLADLVGASQLPDITPVATNTTSRYTWEKPVLKVRRAVEDLDKDDLKSVQAALGSYAHSFHQEADVWTLRGIVAYDFMLKRNRDYGAPEGAKNYPGYRDPVTGQVTGLEWLSLTPSVSFDKVSSQRNTTSEVNSMIYRLSAGLMYQNSGFLQRLWESHILETRLSYGADFSFDQKVYAGEFDFSPIKEAWAINSAFHGFPRIEPGAEGSPWIKYRWLFTVHAEGGTGDEADSNTSSSGKMENFVRIGPIAGVSIVPFALTSLTLNLTCRWYGELTGGQGNSELLNASLQWDLYKDGHYVLTTEYQNGKTPLLQQRDNTITVGLGVKF